MPGTDVDRAAQQLLRALGPDAVRGAVGIAQRFASRAESREEFIWRQIAAAMLQRLQLRLVVQRNVRTAGSSPISPPK